jgi:glycosyltransferase involved in cell wall biosynthesis
VRDLVARARAFVFAAEEDFGIAPVEAMAAGTPVIGLGKGALLETVADGEHGVLFREQTAGSLADAVARFERIEARLDPAAIRRNAERFSRERFDREFKAFVMEKWNASTSLSTSAREVVPV